MPVKRHHKIIIGGFSSFLIILLIANSVFIYFLYGQLQLSYNMLTKEIEESQADTQAKINELTENIIQTKTELNSLGMQVGSIDEEFDLLRAQTSADFSGIIEDAVKSVITVRTNVGQGTGFIITDKGYFVTNAHVLSGANTVQAITYEQGSLPAEFIGFDSELDIALLKINGDFKELKLENSNNAQIGEKVIAIGNPLGLQFSVSEGIISAVERPGPNGIEAYIQTDAALNPGNSGGPLITKEGKVIGINNFKVGGGENLGFALESNYIEDAVNDIAIEELNQTLI